MKKLLAVILPLAMLMALCACSAGGTAAQDTPSGAVEGPTAEDETVPAAAELTYPVEAEWEKSIVVDNVDALLAAIASNTAVYLKAGTYDLSTAANYGQASVSGAYEWDEVYYNAEAGEAPAYELNIHDVSNFALFAESGEVTIVAVPRYANVLRFSNCTDIALGGITAGHTEAPGECSGGVVLLENVNGAQINCCYLYGCGTVGIQAADSRNISAKGTHIFDCSISAVNAYSSSAVSIDHCKIYNCGITGYDGLITVSSCTGFSLTNSDITDCSGANLFSASYSQNTSMLGCTVGGSTAFEQALFSVNGQNITVDNCLFESGIYYPLIYTDYSDCEAVTIGGEGLTTNLIANMQQIETAPSQVSAPPEIELDIAMEEGIRYIHVSTVDELLSAIAPDTVIYLDAEYYDLSSASSYGGFGGEWYSWMADYDGAELNIVGVENLTITSESGAEIVTSSSYADVIHFSNCSYLTLDGVTLGHNVLPGNCSGNVITLNNCTEISIDNCDLYGCGVTGIFAESCEKMSVNNTEIHDCTYCAVNMYSVNNASFTNCDIHDCGELEIYLYDSENVFFDGKAVSSGAYSVTERGLKGADTNSDTYSSVGGLRIYYGEYEVHDCTMHLDDEAAVFTAAYDDGRKIENLTWTLADNGGQYVAMSPIAGNACMVRVVEPVSGGVQLIAADGDYTQPGTATCTILIYTLE